MCLTACSPVAPQKIYESALWPVGINRPLPADSLSYFKAGYERRAGGRRRTLKKHEIFTSLNIFRIFL